MSCRETRPLLPLFVDGELDARQMRSVALHSTRCEPCETELRQIERLQDLVADHVRSRAEEIDVNLVWAGIVPRIGNGAPPWRMRLRDWWETAGARWLVPAPLYAALAAAVALAALWWRPVAMGPAPQLAAVSAVDNSAILDSVESDAASVALLSEPETNTMVLWVSDEEPGAEVLP
jgi:anti-sigma factor RsiW